MVVAYGLLAQGITDTIYIEEVTLYGDYKKYQPGSKFESILLNEIDHTQESGIDQLIGRYAPIYIKTIAGGLSTIRLRGTSPNHTSINFGGININSLTLGHSNVAAIPSFLFDKLELQYGSSSALNGSGAIGGALYLGIKNNWTKGQKIHLKTMQGSFGEQFYGTRIYLGNGKFESVTKLYSFQKKNNFPFKNKYTGNVENREPITDIQQGAAIRHFGLLQEFNYLLTPNEYFISMIWLENFWYQIQPNMQTNYHFSTAEEMQNNNMRIWSEYKNENKPLKFQLGAGYAHDFQVYNKIADQKIITDQLLSEASVKYTVTPKMEYKAGAKYKYIVPDIYAYSDTTISSEQHLDLYFSWFYRPVSRFKTTINLRQLLVTNFKAPFTPSLAAEYLLYSDPFSKFTTSGNVSRSYRIPTLNDRFWVNQGNPDLRPEKGISFETGIKYDFQKGNYQSTVTLNGYYMDINDWIEWRNFGVWQARNVQRVISKGIEFHYENRFMIGEFKTAFYFNYQFNSARIKESGSETSTTGQQLIYTPLHMGNSVLQFEFRNAKLFIDGSYTGRRSANYMGVILDPYFLTNAGLNYQFQLKNQDFNLTFSATNIFNVNYENEKYYAMPGIGFRAGLSVIIQSLTNSNFSYE